MSYWMRSGAIQVGAFQYPLDDFVYSFEVPFEDSEELMKTKIQIYNLGESTRNSIQKYQNVIINAGYQGDIGVIFNGIVSDHKSKQSGLEWITTIEATETMQEWLSSKISKTYKEDIDAQSIIKDLLNIFGVEVSRMELAVNKVYPRGKVCNGPVRNLLREIVTSDCKSIFLVRHGQVFIRNPQKGTSYGVLLTPQSGLLLPSDSTDKTPITPAQDTEKPLGNRIESYTFSRQCLLNYRIAPGDTVRIQDSMMNGDFVVKRGVHKGNRRGDWLTHMEVTPA